VPNSTTRTPATNTTNGWAHNSSTTCCTTNSPPTDKNLPHPNILICHIPKLTYAAPAWWGFSTSADRQRIESFLRRAARSGLWKYATTADDLVNDADESLFWKVRHCAHHVLDELLPPKSDTQHNPTKRRHDLTLPEKKGHLSDKNFIIRMLYKETYWFLSCIIHNLSFSSFIVTLLRSVSSVFTIKIDWVIDWLIDVEMLGSGIAMWQIHML